MSPRTVNILFLLFAVGFGSAESQWVQMSGPDGGHVTTIVVDGDDLLASAYGAGIWRSSDQAVTWARSNIPTENLYVGGLTIDNNEIFATGSTVFHSTDHGYSWNDIGWVLPDIEIHSFAVLDSSIFVGAWGEGIFRSTDRGHSWASANNGLPYLSVSHLITTGTCVLAGTPRGLARSTNNGSTWISVDQFASSYIVELATGKNRIYMNDGRDLYRSIDDGVTWTQLVNPNIGWIYHLSVLGDTLFAMSSKVGYQTLLRSTDAGDTWVAIEPALRGILVSGVVDSPWGLFGTSGMGVFRSTDGGTTWEWTSDGLLGCTITSIAVGGEGLLVSGSQGPFLADTGGVEWTLLNDGLPHGYTPCVALVDSILFVGVSDSGVYASSDKGKSWESRSNGFPEYFRLNSLMWDGNSLIAAMSAGAFRSTDYGLSWTRMGIELFDALLVAVGEGVHYVTATYSGVYTSVDDGISWSRADLYFGGDSSPGGIAATDSTVLVGNPNGGLYRSTNKGVDWETIAGVVGDTYFRCLSFIDGTVVAPSVYGEIFVSTNKGDDWTEASEGLPAVDVNSIAVYDSFVYLGTKSNGVWRRPQGEFVPLAEDDEEEPIIFTYALRQNYPNPFNGRTIISFEIGNPGFVELTVYDVLGQKLQTLLSGDLAAGLHEASLDGGRLSSGVYLYRLKAGDFVQTRKLVLQR